jgi:hypothetical protein
MKNFLGLFASNLITSLENVIVVRKNETFYMMQRSGLDVTDGKIIVIIDKGRDRKEKKLSCLITLFVK